MVRAVDDVRDSAVRRAGTPYLSRVEVRWVAYSAASLAIGALALLLGALITPTGNPADSLGLSREQRRPLARAPPACS